MNISLPLPVPTEQWLQETNARLRKKGILAGERPFTAITQWASLHGQTFDALWHLGGPAFRAIHDYFSNQTSVGRDHNVPINRTCFLYDSSFWEIAVPVGYGRRLVDPFGSVRDMPPDLLEAFRRDTKAMNAFDAHWLDCLEHFSGNDLVERDALCQPLTRKFLRAAMRSLASSVADLLSYPVNLQAAGDSRHAFECALKAVAAEKAGLTEAEAEQVVRHRIGRALGRCQTVLHPEDHKRLLHALNFYPGDDDRYNHSPLSLERVWNCYSEARHAAAVALRVVG